MFFFSFFGYVTFFCFSLGFADGREPPFFRCATLKEMQQDCIIVIRAL